MNRTLPTLALGAALGTAATLYIQSARRAVASPDLAAQIHASALAPPRAVPAAAAEAPASTRERSSLYALAAEADAARLDELLASAVAEPPGAARDFALGVYLRRYLELDAPRAIETARSLSLAPDALAALYGEWA